ncbi:MAG: hypothetical protein CSA40_01560 [Flavobacteriales bacterium]|nr:MAG: hypothetical protein CSA40_01560 [Flavobacteriales bacterium]
MKYLTGILLVLGMLSLTAQTKKIQILHSDNTMLDEVKYPEAIVALGNVLVEHEGATLQCKQALIYQKQNIIKAFGDVLINQADTLTQSSKYVEYNGNTKIAKSWGNVILKDQKMTLTTDTLQFNRSTQILYYDDFATIEDHTNTLKSKKGRYYLHKHKFEAESKVTIVNPDQTLTSDHLDYYTDTGQSYMFGPSTIQDSINTLSFEKGFHDSKTKQSFFSKNAKITYKDRVIEGDSMYYDEQKHFASSTNNITVTDTINNVIVKGQYAEYYETKDSVYIVGKPYTKMLMDQDSMFIHGDTLMVTGPSEQRIVRAFHHVKFYKSDLQGKCDSLFNNEKQGITKMYRKPVIWHDKHQITGDSIHFLTNPKTNKLDSLKIYNRAFLASKDTAGGFNQIKGKFIYSKFVNDTIDNTFIDGNSQMVYYHRDEKTSELIGVDTETSSNIFIQFDKGELAEITFLTQPDGKTYPPSKLPETAKILEGFIWRQNERPKSKDDIFVHDEGDDDIMYREPVIRTNPATENDQESELKPQENPKEPTTQGLNNATNKSGNPIETVPTK